jgi:hypothetical protein
MCKVTYLLLARSIPNSEFAKNARVYSVRITSLQSCLDELRLQRINGAKGCHGHLYKHGNGNDNYDDDNHKTNNNYTVFQAKLSMIKFALHYEADISTPALTLQSQDTKSLLVSSHNAVLGHRYANCIYYFLTINNHLKIQYLRMYRIRSSQ